MNVLCAVGARPNFMKIKPVLDALEDASIPSALVHTGQHYDFEMSEAFFKDLDLKAPDYHLGVGSGTHAEEIARIMLAFEPVLDKEKPDVVVVVGDVNSTLACALVASRSDAALVHVEAGLRSGDWRMPEEVNRVVTDHISDAWLAPSADAVTNLTREGKKENEIDLVGNVMADSLLKNLERARKRSFHAELGLEADSYALVTLHRPENVDDPQTLQELMTALEAIADRMPVVLPAHPRLRKMLAGSAEPVSVRLLRPLSYLDFISLQDRARVVLTDSGGIQEEATILGIPCLTLRDSTERPITIEHGTNRLAGNTKGRVVTEALKASREDRREVAIPLWDGHAGDRSVAAIVRRFS